MISFQETVRWIDKNDSYLLFPKLIFFFVNFILYTTYTYQLDYLADVWNLNITSSGFITSIPIISFFSAIGWSTLAQRSGKYKEIILAVIFFYSLSFCSFQVLATILKESDDWKRFTAVSAIYGTMSVLSSALFPLLDHKMYLKLSKDERFAPEMFGRQRLWGTVGQGVAGFVAGWGIKNYGYPSIFIFSAFGSIVFGSLVLFGFETSSTIDVNEKKVERKENEIAVKSLSWSAAMRKLMLGKIDEAVVFVKNGVTKFCDAHQFASASDAAMSIFEYADKSNSAEMKEILNQLLKSSEGQYWRKFLNEMGKHDIISDSSSQSEIVELIFASNPSGNSDKLSALSNLILQLSGEARQSVFPKFVNCLTSVRDESTILQLHVFFISEFSLNLIKECQFYDNELFLKIISSVVNGREMDQIESIAPIGNQEFKLFNFCVLLHYLCQRKSPTQTLFTDLLNEYLPESICKLRPDLARLRNFAENSVCQTFWPAPKARNGPGAGGPPPDLMNMLQGLLGPQMRR